MNANMSGTLYLVATPIGNLEDITYRAVKTLNEVDLVAAEDTRQTIKLLNHFKISKPLTSYYEHNKKSKGEYLINELLSGKNIALVSDAGTPAISDPGEDLVKEAIKNGITIVPIPGACAGITGLIISGFDTGKFSFEGFLPKNKRNKKERLEEIKKDTRTLIFYEAPHKIVGTLECMLEVLGNRNICIARELTKKFEEINRTTIADAINRFNEVPPRGEFVIIIEGKTFESIINNEVNEEYIIKKVEEYIKEGNEKNSSIKAAAKELGLSKRDVYNMYLSKKEPCGS